MLFNAVWLDQHLKEFCEKEKESETSVMPSEQYLVVCPQLVDWRNNFGKAIVMEASSFQEAVEIYTDDWSSNSDLLFYLSQMPGNEVSILVCKARPPLRPKIYCASVETKIALIETEAY